MIFIDFLLKDLQTASGNLFSPFLNQFKIQAFICALKALFFRKSVKLNLLNQLLIARYLKLKIKYAYGNHLLFKNEKLLITYLDLLVLCQIKRLVFVTFLEMIGRLN